MFRGRSELYQLADDMGVELTIEEKTILRLAEWVSSGVAGADIRMGKERLEDAVERRVIDWLEAENESARLVIGPQDLVLPKPTNPSRIGFSPGAGSR